MAAAPDEPVSEFARSFSPPLANLDWLPLPPASLCSAGRARFMNPQLRGPPARREPGLPVLGWGPGGSSVVPAAALGSAALGSGPNDGEAGCLPLRRRCCVPQSGSLGRGLHCGSLCVWKLRGRVQKRRMDRLLPD